MSRTKLPKPIRYALSMVLIVLLSTWAAASWTFADPDGNAPKISLKREIGYNLIIKEGRWAPLKLTLTSDVNVSGDIVVRVDPLNGGDTVSYIRHVELPRNTPKEVVIGMAGIPYNKSSNTIQFFEGSVKDGTSIPFTTKNGYVESMTVPGTAVGVLSSDPDTMNFLNTLRSKGKDVSVIPMVAGDVPSDPMLLDMLDVIVMNNFASDMLSQEQVKAVKNWVGTGGTLVLAGGEGYAKTVRGFEDLSPVEVKGTQRVTKLPELAQLGAKPLSLEDGITLSAASIKPGTQVLLRSEGQPIFASHVEKQGKVWYAAYNAGTEPLASWSGHPAVWQTVLQKDFSQTQNQNNYGYWGTIPGNLLQLGNALDYFPALHVPSFGLMLLILLIYVIVAAPLMYLILKKLDKREWAWLLIPSVALISSAIIYAVGASDKNAERSHTISVVEMDGQGSGQRVSATAFFAPRSGDYELEFPAQTYIGIGNSSGGSFIGGQSGNASGTYIDMGQGGTKVNLNEVPYWSISKVWAQQRANEQVGAFETKISVNDQGDLQGTVKNTTDRNFSNVVIVMGGKLVKLGDMKSGETLPLQSSGGGLGTAFNDLGSAIFPYYGGQDVHERERIMLNSYLPSTALYNARTYVLAWNNDELLSYKSDGRRIAGEQLNLWLQKVNLNWSNNGTISVPYGFVSPSIITGAGSGWNQNGNNLIDMGQGSMILDYDMPSGITASKLNEIHFRQQTLGQNTDYAVMNWQTQKWEPVKWTKNLYSLMQGAFGDYLLNGRTLRLRITVQNQTTFSLPDLSLKGKGNTP
ncbi:hypothetical protein Q5741_12905 [Paenibacillus sp. JX-17]|uniref:DUF7408 domain-containing protein n=1 Tax=Paenibacillus lacisoli TaxID=3064525 RepID=A0ABT9CDJ7_9BACL|nr:hypothetical protein [Paenibacillus sp. JX-17]MDO7907306.1 hypothetical protein [Paenibacillus sp. JX-17]